MNANDDDDGNEPHHDRSSGFKNNTMSGSNSDHYDKNHDNLHVDPNATPATGAAVAVASSSMADSSGFGAPTPSTASSTILVGESNQKQTLDGGRSSSTARQQRRKGSSSHDFEDSDPVFLASVASAEAKLEGVARRANPSRSPTRQHRPSSPSSPQPLYSTVSPSQPPSQPPEGAVKPLPLSAPLHALGDRTGSSDTYWADGLSDVIKHALYGNDDGKKSGSAISKRSGDGADSPSCHPSSSSSSSSSIDGIISGGLHRSGGMPLGGAARAAKAAATSSSSSSAGLLLSSPVAQPPPEPQSAAAAAWRLGVVLPQPATDPITRMPCVLQHLRSYLTHCIDTLTAIHRVTLSSLVAIFHLIVLAFSLRNLLMLYNLNTSAILFLHFICLYFSISLSYLAYHRYRPLLTGLTHTEQRLLFTLLTFPQVKVLRDLRANGPGPLVRRMATYSLLSGALSIGLFALSIWYVCDLFQF